jgi:hypothetical protein
LREEKWILRAAIACWDELCRVVLQSVVISHSDELHEDMRRTLNSKKSFSLLENSKKIFANSLVKFYNYKFFLKAFDPFFWKPYLF